MCVRLKVGGYRTAAKNDMVDLMVNAYSNKQIYDTLMLDHDNDIDGAAIHDVDTPDDPQLDTRKKAQCPYRLLNILFSDEFAEDFGALTNKATRDQLDRGVAALGKHFWIRVQPAFIDATNVEADDLKFRDNAMYANSKVDPSVIVPHSWQKLSGIWSSIWSKYKDVYGKFHVSGQHRKDFHKFCHGQLEVYYLWNCFEYIKPDLKSCFASMLPEGIGVSSDEPVGMRPTVTLSASTTPSPSVKKRGKRERDIDGLISSLSTEKSEKQAFKKTQVDYMLTEIQTSQKK